MAALPSKVPENDPVAAEYAYTAPDYDTKWSFYIEATTRETLARLHPGPEDRVLDVGCGTGALLYRLAAAHPEARLVGVDLVPEMLSVAQRRLPPRVELLEGSAEQLPFAEGSFDAVVSCNMFHYLRQPATALQEMRRVLRPGGQLVITDWCDDYWACRICDWYLRLFNRAHFKTYGGQECRRLLEAAGFETVSIDRYKINWLWGLMTARAEEPTDRPGATAEKIVS